MNIGWPELIYIGLQIAGATRYYMQIKDREKVDIVPMMIGKLLASASILALLYWGGFFD